MEEYENMIDGMYDCKLLGRRRCTTLLVFQQLVEQAHSTPGLNRPITTRRYQMTLSIDLDSSILVGAFPLVKTNGRCWKHSALYVTLRERYEATTEPQCWRAILPLSYFGQAIYSGYDRKLINVTVSTF
jgi:hypothetical protein